MEPGAQFARLRPAAAAAALRLGLAVAEERGNDEAAADNAEELASVELQGAVAVVQLVALGLVEEEVLVHRPASCIRFAAFSTAVRMRE